MVYRNNTCRLGFRLHQCVLRIALAGSKTVVSISRNPTVNLSFHFQILFSFRTQQQNHLFTLYHAASFDYCVCTQVNITNARGLGLPGFSKIQMLQYRKILCRRRSRAGFRCCVCTCPVFGCLIFTPRDPPKFEACLRNRA